MPIDFREVPKGCGLDEFHFELWAGLMQFLIGKDEVRAAFKEETGLDYHPPRSGLERMIDEATGAGKGYAAKFCAWATPIYFGGEDMICPSIADKLSEGGG